MPVCHSNHWNDGNDYCEDCGADLNADPVEPVFIKYYAPRELIAAELENYPNGVVLRWQGDVVLSFLRV